MKVTSIRLHNFRSFVDSGTIGLGQVNVFIGANNSGKSSILKALYLMQVGCDSGFPDVRIGTTNTFVEIGIDNVSSNDYWGHIGSGQLTIRLDSGDRLQGNMGLEFVNADGNRSLAQFPTLEPKHFVVPFLSRRKPTHFQEDIKAANAMLVSSNMQYLAAKLSRISNPGIPAFSRFSETCNAILGLLVTGIPSANGQLPGIHVTNSDSLPIGQMGDGVANIVALLADLAISKDKLFVIEEPENDLHPGALKALLDLIVESSASNQFVISTHSNIVLRHLGAVDGSMVYSITTTPGSKPTEAKVTAVEQTPQARLEVLQSLGYSFSDFDLWDGWLILEEASAERIIRDFLIPWFAPKLSRVRTLSTGGNAQVESTFDDFHRLVRFTHLEAAYKDAAWVRVDGDASGKKIVQQLHERYPSWKPDRFNFFVKEQFEHYYPIEFQGKVDTVLSIQDGQERRKAKRSLLNELVAWLDADKNRGIAALSASAKEIIDDLKIIEAQLR